MRCLSAFLAAVLLLLVGGCAAPLPARTGMRSSEALAYRPNTSLGRLATALAPGQETRYQLFEEPESALALRRLLIRSAEKTLDLQYFIWDADATGLLLLSDLAEAAHRGVRIRLLLDDANSSRIEPYLMALLAVPNVEVRMFNPFPGSRDGMVAKFMSAIGDWSRVRFRMHNKLLVADDSLALTGGRNVADAYLTSRRGNFFDLDLLLAGPLVQELSDSFDDYWNSNRSYDLALLADGVTAPRQIGRRTAPSGAVLPASFLHMARCPARVFVDPEDKAFGTSLEDSSLTVHQRLIQLFTDSRKRILIVSPYFVRGTIGMERIATRIANHIDVKVVTNSLASTDEPAAHIVYLRYRRTMLRLGVDLHEFAPEDAGPGAGAAASPRQASRLHAKFSVVDHRHVYIGSMNFTARSERINTEIGVILDCPSLAERLETLVAGLRTYHLSLADGPLGVQWVKKNQGGEEQAWAWEPEASWWQRFKAAVLSPFVPEEEI